ncbi:MULTISPECIES: hypothetical protein [unclassified Sphingomonas]|uniref:hypothetical protein n=1 Tax=unclassified Sphingomonas TaxID=196159 RepID=UPI000288CCE0|nr:MULTISPECIES: hypothetical protein [unclassified Sphingomonas]
MKVLPRIVFCLATLLFSITVFAQGPGGHGIVDRLDHYATGFPLEGGHERVACEDCHRGGVFKGTPRRCGDCHNGVLAEARGPRHIPTALSCDSCHSVQDWRLSRFDHSDVLAGCVRCHNNFTAPGKTATHPATSNICEDCHDTVHWKLLLPGIHAIARPPAGRTREGSAG